MDKSIVHDVSLQGVSSTVLLFTYRQQINSLAVSPLQHRVVKIHDTIINNDNNKENSSNSEEREQEKKNK